MAAAKELIFVHAGDRTPVELRNWITTDLIDWLDAHAQELMTGDVLLLDLDYTVWNGNFDSTPTYDGKYARHAQHLAPLIRELQCRGVKVFGFTGKPLATETMKDTGGLERAKDALAVASITFSRDLGTVVDEPTLMVVHEGIIFTDPRNQKRSVDAKCSVLEVVRQLSRASRIIWIDDQDVEYARGKSFQCPVICVPFESQLSI